MKLRINLKLTLKIVFDPQYDIGVIIISIINKNEIILDENNIIVMKCFRCQWQ